MLNRVSVRSVFLWTIIMAIVLCLVAGVWFSVPNSTGLVATADARQKGRLMMHEASPEEYRAALQSADPSIRKLALSHYAYQSWVPQSDEAALVISWAISSVPRDPQSEEIFVVMAAHGHWVYGPQLAKALESTDLSPDRRQLVERALISAWQSAMELKDKDSEIAVHNRAWAENMPSPVSE